MALVACAVAGTERAMTPIVISPPFGNYRLPGTAGLTRIAGSFTVLPRPGRWRRVAATVRPTACG